MIRNRLALAFASLALLSIAQALFMWWATSAAAHHSERSVVAARMLAEYLEISGNKQRLKVWFAEHMLTGEADPEVRDRLEAAIADSLASLRALAARRDVGVPASESREVELVAENIAVMSRAIREAERVDPATASVDLWRDVLRAFDELAGRDMRALLREAVMRQEAASRVEAERLARLLERERVAIAGMAALIVALGIIAVLYFVRRLDRPFAELTRLTEALGRGDYAARSQLAGNDEFGRIGGLLDSMATSLAEAQARSEALEHRLDELVSERTRVALKAHDALLDIEAGRRRFFAELSHELRTPVTVIRGEAELALRGPGDAIELKAALRRIVEAAGEIGARVRDLVEAARDGSLGYALATARVPIAGVVRAAVTQMQAVAEVRGVRLEHAGVVPESDAVVEGDRERLQQVLAILIDNAIRYSPRGGVVRVGMAGEAEHWLMHVDDEGPGMTDEEIRQAFEPHFRGSAARAIDRDGLGIGLGIARRIATAHRGDIELARRADGGLRATLVLPRLAEATSSGATEAACHRS